MEEIEEQTIAQIKALEAKYGLTGQDLRANLEGLLYTNYLKYWDYIQVDTLLTLQKTRTNIPDEFIFITYHQIGELYFKLVLWEMDQVAKATHITAQFFINKLKRINRYFEIVNYSLDVMSEGMEAEQFRKFRMALLPASGFQSVQFRMIEIAATDLYNLVEKEYRQQNHEKAMSIEEMYEHIYWKRGATETATGKKTITLEHFEEKYATHLLVWAKDHEQHNLWRKFQDINPEDALYDELVSLMRRFDYLVNIEWTLGHFKSAAKYLKPQGTPIEATGGTNWTKYLPPRFQKRIFFPELWSVEEKENWGKPQDSI